MRLAALDLRLQEGVTEEQLQTLREGDKLLVAVNFVGWNGGSTSYGTAKTLLTVEVPLFKLENRFIAARPESMQIFGAQVQAVHRAEAEAGDLVHYESLYPGETYSGFGKVIAIDGKSAMVRQIRPTAGSRIVPVNRLSRALSPDDLTETEREALK